MRKRSIFLLIVILLGGALTQKVAALVQRAFASVKSPLGNMNLFHTDRGTEFKNVAID